MKFYLLAAIAATFQIALPNLEATDFFPKNLENENHLFVARKSSCTSSSSDHCKRGPRGRQGPRGPQGFNGDNGRNGLQGVQGPTGATGPTFEINDYIEATNGGIATVEPFAYIPFNSPIVYPTNGIDAPNGMTLVESVPSSGIFDTITLPIESTNTIYLVTFGISVSVENINVFQLELNGTALPYTSLGFNGIPGIMQSQTSIVVNPANVAGTLRISATASFEYSIQPPTEGSSSAFITVLKLNNNAP